MIYPYNDEKGSTKGKPCRRRTSLRNFALCLCVSVALSSCAAVVNPSGTTPARPATPIENALAYNASLADANQTITAAVISAQKSGLIDVPTTTSITSVQFTIADSDRQVTGMLNAIAQCQATPPAAGAPPCIGNAVQLNTLIQRITSNAQLLTNSGVVGIKDANTKSTVSLAVSTIGQMASLIVTTLQNAKLIQ